MSKQIVLMFIFENFMEGNTPHGSWAVISEQKSVQKPIHFWSDCKLLFENDSNTKKNQKYLNM